MLVELRRLPQRCPRAGDNVVELLRQPDACRPMLLSKLLPALSTTKNFPRDSPLLDFSELIQCARDRAIDEEGDCLAGDELIQKPEDTQDGENLRLKIRLSHEMIEVKELHKPSDSPLIFLSQELQQSNSELESALQLALNAVQVDNCAIC